ncbi:Transmembrane amino acid transporter protein [Popillia japonica]|uniref:Transmembrane amino acid transporter protein n=1 Tax=Popillia japonica TaxID=7064 RepID=A0AAW1LZV1_POPJA
MANEALKLEPVGKKYNDEKGGASPRSPEDDDYDPHLHRNVEHPTSNTETIIHLLKGSLGTGILAMPEAFKNSGLATGAIFTVIIGFICTYCLHILVNAQYALCKRLRVPILTYPESMRIALETGPPGLRGFARMSPLLVDIFLILYQLGICCVYVLFVAVNVQPVCNELFKVDLDLKIYMLTLLIPFILINSIRNLKLLAPFSILANIITFASFAVVLYYIFEDLPSIEGLPQFAGFYTFPLFFGTTLFALEAVGVVIAVENNMKTPKSFGFLGYWRYGEGSEPSITLNFPKEDTLAKCVNILYSLAIFISYGLQGYVPVQIMWETYIVKHLQNSSPKMKLLYEYILRIVAVIITFILAGSIPLLGLFISLFGAFCLSALGIAFPAIMEICVNYSDNLTKWCLIKNLLLIIFGVVGLLAGSYSALSEIIVKLGETPILRNETTTLAPMYEIVTKEVDLFTHFQLLLICYHNVKSNHGFEEQKLFTYENFNYNNLANSQKNRTAATILAAAVGAPKSENITTFQAEYCRPASCILPNCRCISTDIPNNLPSTEIPQMVLLTFDDAVTAQTYDYYERAFFGRKNPDGCEIQVTYYVSHEYTDYSKVHALHARGHEIALHSITHEPYTYYWDNLDEEGYYAEFGGERELIAKFANIPRTDIQGIRVPLLQLAGDRSFQAIERSGMMYDSSWPTQAYMDPPAWPYTLNYLSDQDCPIGACPTSSFPGMWVQPMVNWLDNSGYVCSMVDSCIFVPTDTQGVLDFIKRNFHRHYDNNRAPFGFYVHAAWFLRNPNNFEAYLQFLDYLESLNDVYIVSVQRALEWVRNPKTLNQLSSVWSSCPATHAIDCAARNCGLQNDNGEMRYMTQCLPGCPARYPWLFNPLGL